MTDVTTLVDAEHTPASGTPERASRMPGARRARTYPYLVWPVLAVLMILIAVPVVAMFYGAVQDGNLGSPKGTSFSLRALVEVYLGWPYISTLLGTVGLALAVALLSTAIGSLFAWIMSRTDVRLRKFFELTVIAPLFLSPFIGAIAWMTLGAPKSGMLNVNLRHLFGADFTLIDVMNVPGMIFVMTMYYVPYGYLLVGAALRNMDPSLEDASYINGNGHLRTAFRVTLPLVRPAMAAAFFFIAVLSTGVFSVPGVLGGRDGFVPLAVRIYRATEVFPSDYAVAASIGTMLFLVTIIGVFFYRRAVANAARFVTVSGRGFRPRIIKLGRWRWVVTAVLVINFIVAIVLPYIALTIVSLTPYAQTDFTKLDLSLDNFTAVLTAPKVVEASWNTLLLGVGSPTACVVLGVLVAFITVRSGSPIRGVIDYLATIPLAIPGLVLATGMIWLYIRTPIYGTLWILLVAHVAAYLTHASRLAANGLIQIDKSLEEASIVNGASLPRTLWRITTPLIRPSLLSAWILIFIFSVREINEAIMLYSARSNVLSVVTWDYMQNGQIRQAAVVGILQTVGLILGVLVARYAFRVKLTSASL
ncbi:ABC transporter permease subunit [Microbacterium sp. SYP-A9085]|uniref:ABC transporter permease n=1 Tax=Microbacterium sp. SYP-A9085 TaxID=2664454 RepID=UPI00129A192B|nr:ABC transporter permease subunit [Microbacterium sp. SYP-A9085]